jgi:hypothetical protein
MKVCLMTMTKSFLRHFAAAVSKEAKRSFEPADVE